LEKPQEEYAGTTVQMQAKKASGAPMEFLNKLTSAVISDLFYNEKRTLRYVSAAGFIFPESYSRIMIDTVGNKPYPFLHRTGFVVRGTPDDKLEFEFNFLRLQKSYLRQNHSGKWYNYTASPIDVDGVKHTPGTETPEKISIKIGTYSIKELLEGINNEFPFEKHDNEELISQDARKVFQMKNLLVNIELSCREISGGTYSIAIDVKNSSEITTTAVRGYNLDDVTSKCLFGAHTIARCSGCVVVPTPVNGSTPANINTFPALSDNLVFSSPIVVYDDLLRKPANTDMQFGEVTKDKDVMMSKMTLLTEQERRKLADMKYDAKILSVLSALEKSNAGRIDSLHEFQWVAIQKFVKKIISDDSGPLIIRAPTGSGKSLVFYTCTALMKVLKPDLNDTFAFITFPTRALNSQQFSEMVRFFYFLNKEGIKISLGMYMGQYTDAAVKPLDPSAYSDGDQIGLIESCPECSCKKIIVKKPHSERMLPVCQDCKAEFSNIFLSNRETEQFCPNVLIGTPDKIVNALTHNVYSHTVFGAPSVKCKKCGSHKGLCWKDQKDEIIKCKVCGNENDREKCMSRSTPCFVVFDEVHTLSGTSGNLLSHFLSLLQVVSRNYGNKEKFWYLGASATIANQTELLHNLTGYPEDSMEVFPEKNDFEKYFPITKRVRHRYVITEPLTYGLRAYVSESVNLLSHFTNSSKNNGWAAKLANDGIKFDESYNTQTVYVLRKDDGRDLEKFIPENAVKSYGPGSRPIVRFGSGDLTSNDISELNKEVKSGNLDVLVVTRIYGQGVDFPGLNIIHFFGTPRSFIELHQVVGRTGRSHAPGIVFLHTDSKIPRDNWVYHNFRTMIGDIEGYYEPTPINFANMYAIDLSLPNVIHTLLMMEAYKDHTIRYGKSAFNKFGADETLLGKLLEDVISVYDRKMRDTERDSMKKIAANKILEVFEKMKENDNTTKKILENVGMLVGTLYRTEPSVHYEPFGMTSALWNLRASRSVRDEGVM
jgi:superfamily II DNA/RNA helicase